jgi:D-sedoheptulose 7-phosphate isomerase
MTLNIKSQIKDLVNSVEIFLQDESNLNKITKISELVIDAFKSGNKTFFCGNGGSASEAQHLAAELSGKFKIDRKPLPAEACHINPSFITAVSNDYSFERSFERYIEAFASKGDILFGLSTSGNSVNVLRAFQKANELEINTVAFTGESGGKLSNIADIIIKVPSNDVARIQEMHLLIGHIICEAVEKELFC